MKENLQADDMIRWAIVTAGGSDWYLADLGSIQPPHDNEGDGQIVGRVVRFGRAYAYLESINFQTGECTRLAFPPGLYASCREVTMRVLVARSLERWSSKDRATVADLVNAADKARRTVVDDPRIIRPNGPRVAQ